MWYYGELSRGAAEKILRKMEVISLSFSLEEFLVSFSDKTNQEVKKEQTKGRVLTLQLAGKVPDKIEILINSCCIYSAIQRISFHDIFDFLEKYYDIIDEDMYAYEVRP